MNNKHTPGPWEIGDEHPETGILRVLSKKDYICVVMPNPDDEASPEENYGQAKANALLIAAAPDLLEAAQSLLITWRCSLTDAENDAPTIDQFCEYSQILALEAAIKKAKGEE